MKKRRAQMSRKLTTLVALLLTSTIIVGCVSQQQIAFKSIEGKNHSAVTPVQRTDKWWLPRQDAVNERLKQGKVDMLFIGDSITQGWEGAGKEIWSTYYTPRNAVNMGFSGDRTQHVLWRLDHSNLEGLSPKLAIIMIGTNNSNRNDNTAEEIADGIIAICHRLRTKLPQTKILLLAIFPRNSEPSAQRQKNAEASRIISKVADGRTIYYLDINSKFLKKAGLLTKDIMPDYLHPNKAGYKIWAEAIEPKVARLMGERKLSQR
jgi:beta-glucosidase